MLHPTDIPRDENGPRGSYRLQYGALSETFPGAAFVGGVASPVDGRTAERLHLAFGADCAIYPADDETLELVVAWLRSRGAVERVDTVLGLATEPAPQAAATAPVAAEAPPPADARPEPEIPQDLPLVDPDVDASDDVEALRSTAEALGVQVGKRWTVDRLKAEIRKAREGM